MQYVEEAINSSDGSIQCFINPLSPTDGAYVKLNDIVTEPEQRMFKYYEGWIIFVTPLAVLLAIFLAILILFLKGDLSAAPIQKPKESFGEYTGILWLCLPWNELSTR